MMRYFLYLFLVLLASACKTSSGTYREDRDMLNSRLVESWKNELFSQSVVDSLFKKLSFSLKATITNFAPVDSCGRQSVESITQVNLSGEQQTGQSTVTNTARGTEEQQKEKEESADKTKIAETLQTDSRVFRPPDWLWPVLTTIAAALLCYFRRKIKNFFCHLILILKRFFI
jgi:hypothetical protein